MWSAGGRGLDLNVILSFDQMSKNVDQLNTSLKNTSSISGGGGGDLPPSIQAYKSDNAKLIKENNELHLELIKIKDDFETQLKGLPLSISLDLFNRLFFFLTISLID